MILILDNYDSFTYNLYQYLGIYKKEVEVLRSDAISLEDLNQKKPSGLLLSPGPGHPSESGITLDAIRQYAGKIPILGVCLGHQAIGMYFGGKIMQAGKIMHGKRSNIFHSGEGIFQGLKNPFLATRYHSLVIDRDSIPNSLKIIAESDDGEIMGIQHKEYNNLWGIQFHPESILSEEGLALVRNFVNHCET
jgi:anthranilate synthase/aminodeoxychorismate synthase-like glutamine amidotransferase